MKSKSNSDKIESLQSFVTRLFAVLELATAHLLGLEVLVQQEESRLVSLGSAHDGEHAFASLIMRSLGDRDAGARSLADLADLAASAADDASHHVCRNANVLRLDFFTILIVRRWAAAGGIRVGSASERARAARRAIAEVGTVASAHDTRAGVLAASSIGGAVSSGSDATISRLRADNGVVEDGARTALPVVDEALADLPNGALDSFGGTLNLDNSFGGLGKHFLLRNHANSRGILNVLDLQALSADDGSHLVVRDEKLDGYGYIVSILQFHGRQGRHQGAKTYGEYHCWR